MAYTTIDDPSAHFQAEAYTGDGGSARAVTFSGNSDLQPDWVWIKNRGTTNEHLIFDSVRGVQVALNSNDKTTNDTISNSLTAFNSDGFTIAGNTSCNANNNTYASWNWKAGTAASGNTSGSGTAKTFSSSSSSTAGFSIVTYVGNGTANHAIPHGCGAAPTMIIVKTTTKSNQAWPVDNRQVNGIMYLDETGAAGSYGDSSPFTSVAPTSSVFSVGSPGNTNYNDDTYIAYCFAEVKGYSKFGSYKGNGNANGTFVYTGFKPALVIVKKYDSETQDWFLMDNKRNGFNGQNYNIESNTNQAEQSNSDIDILSNGFKTRSTGNGHNTDDHGYIFMAFAEQPFVTSTGIPATAR